MSRQIALDTISLKPTSRLAHTDYSVEYHGEYVSARTGVDPGDPGFARALNDFWAMDFVWLTNDGLHGDWASCGRATDMGHAEYARGGADKRTGDASPFRSRAEVWAFDAVAEYGLPDFDKQVAEYERLVRERRAQFPNQLTPGGYYKTIVSGAIAAFGWEMLLLAASEASKMEKVFDSFYRRSLFHMNAWAATSVEVVIQHDDFVWTEGAFMKPDIYRRVIIPRYASLWKPLHEAGKKVLFCSDGNFLEFAADVVDAGADGLIFEPCMDFGTMVERFGGTTCLVGSYVDCRDMAFGTWDKVRQSMDRTFELAHKCKGLIFAVGNHIPANVPEEMMDRYIEHLKAGWHR